MIKIKPILIMTIFLTVFAGGISVQAAEEEKWYSGSIEIGGNAALDELKRSESGAKGGAEYNSIIDKEWSSRIGGTLFFDRNDITFQGSGLYLSGDDQEYGGSLSLGRVLIYRSEYNRFIHRLDHDYMENLEAHIFPDLDGDGLAGGNWASEVTLPDDNGVDGATTVGAANVYSTDLDPNEQYKVIRSLWENHVKLNIPQIPELKFTINHRFEERKGHKQVMSNSKCLSCHVVSMGKKIHEKTNDFSPKVSLRLGTVALEYSYMHREFDVNDDDVTFLTNDLGRGWAPERVQYGRYGEDNTGGASYYEEVPFSRTPDSTKDTHKAKIRWDINGSNTVVASYIYSKSTNEAVDREYDIISGYYGEDIELDSHLAQIKWSSRLSRAISFNLYGKYHHLDNDEPFIDKRDQISQLTPAQLALYEDYVYWEDEYRRKSGYDSDKYLAGANLTWKVLRDLKLRFGYEFKHEERDNYEYHNVPEDTTEHILEASADWRVNRHFKLDGGLELEFIDDQYAAIKGTCPPWGSFDRYGSPGALVDRFDPARAYEQPIYSARVAERSNLPNFVFQPRIKGHWHISPSLNSSFHLKYRYAENDDLGGRDWQQDQVVAGLNLVYTPMEKLTLSAGYTYFYDKYESQFCIAIYDG